MERKEKAFTPGPNCLDEEACKMFGSCLEAHILKIEIGYEEEWPKSSALKDKLCQSKCKHPQAIDARKKAREILGENGNSE